MLPSAARVSSLTIAYGGRSVFEKFDLKIARGETLAVLGPSGCGKSTLLRAIARLVRPGAGRIECAGEIGVVFQEPRLMPWLDVARNVAFAARTPAERARVPALLELVGLSDSARLLPKELSGGMAQRASLARTLVRAPSLLLLDEPLSALDALLRLELQTALALAIREQRCAAILVTHDVDEALYLADRVIVLGTAPARTVLALDVPPERRRSRSAGHLADRQRLLGALGVAGFASPGATAFDRLDNRSATIVG